jgi:hypothetical protein
MDDMDVARQKLRDLYGTNGPPRSRAAELRRKLGPAMLAKTVSEAVSDQFAAAIRPLVKRIRDLEARLKEIEQRGHVEFQGAWQRASSYERGNLVVHDSAVWCATRDSVAERPGDADAWQLLLKSHR